MTEPFQKPLNADEIEAWLRTAREHESKNRADIVSNEPLGPGDVQYLRNSPVNHETLANDSWPYDATNAEDQLQRAEQHLAAAMAPDGVPPAESPTFAPADFQPLGPSPETFPRQAVGGAGLPLEVIGDIEVDVTLELGGAELTIEDLLALREGSVVTLDKAAGEPIDILANGKLIARGEVLVVEEKYCVRICEVVGH